METSRKNMEKTSRTDKSHMVEGCQGTQVHLANLTPTQWWRLCQRLFDGLPPLRLNLLLFA